MDEYTTAACPACNQAIYLPRRKLEASLWACPACGAENNSLDTRQPALAGVASSRFARARDRA